MRPILPLLAASAMPLLALTSLPEPGIPQSCGIQIKNDTFNVETIQLAHDLGFRILRKGMYWSSIEKEKGKYTFAEYDPKMAKARELGMLTVFTLFGSNQKLYDNGGSDRAIITEESRQGFARAAAAAAAHYKGQNIIFEIWNEPNVQTFWRKGKHNSPEFAKEYTDLVKACTAAMLAADPNCFIVAGSVSNYWQPSYEWTESCFREGILKTGIRAWSVHPYGVKTPEEFKVGHDITRDLLKKYGAPNLTLIDTERGFTATKREEGWSGGAEARVKDYQAWHIVRQFLIDQMCGLALTSWYELRGNEGFSLFDGDAPRPALEAFQTMIRELSGYHYASRLPSDNPRDYLLVYENAAGERKLVAWTSPAPGGSPDETLEHVIVLPTATLPASGLLGKATPAPVGLTLALSGAPQYVALPKNQAFQPAVSIGPAVLPTAPASALAPVQTQDLALFSNTSEWKFIPNTGKGSITLGTSTDGKPSATLAYDFSEYKGKSTPYVIASVPTQIAAGATSLQLHVRTPIAQQVTVRLTDATGQTLQSKLRARGTQAWEPLSINLTKKMEHWDGANDGKVHFPIKTLSLSIPRPGTTLSGSIEIADIGIVTGGK